MRVQVGLAGHTALFPAVAAAWSERLAEAEQLLAIGRRMIELDEPQLALSEPTVDPAQVEAFTDQLAKGTRLNALLRLEEGRAALRVATQWLRPMLVVAQPVSVESGGPTDAAR